MDPTEAYRRPSKRVAAVLGLFIPPAGVLYLAPPGWGGVLFALEIALPPAGLFLPREREWAADAVLLLVGVACAVQAYRYCKDSRVLRRPWYGRWPGLLVIIAAFAALGF